MSAAFEFGDTNIVYCGPEVWLRDASIRDNVIGYLPFDSTRSDAAIKSCQLEEDLEQLHERDSYIIAILNRHYIARRAYYCRGCQRRGCHTMSQRRLS